MGIRKNYKDIMLVDETGRTEYFSISSTEFFDLKPEELIGTRPLEHYDNLNAENSTLMRAVNYGETILHYVQELSTSKGKIVRQDSDTFCVKDGDKIVGAIEFAYYDESKDILEQPGRNRKKQKKVNVFPVLSDVICEAESMREIKRKLEKVVNLEAPVLLTGETGTGKEMIARAIHNSGSRKNGNFVYVNCGALPENLIESMLFGMKKGSFTDAAEREGLFLAAHHGTLFLDEIHSMPIETQGKILRVIEEKRIRPIGGDEEISVDVRIIASCNIDADLLIHSDVMRKDLYFRLSVIQFELPPLRERKEDILPLVNYYIEKFNLQLHDKKITSIDAETKRFFKAYDWPGNVRELRNTIECAFYMAQEEKIKFNDIEERFADKVEDTIATSAVTNDFIQSGLDLKAYIRKYEKQCIQNALDKTDQDLKQAAKLLGITEQMLKYNIEKFHINAK